MQPKQSASSKSRHVQTVKSYIAEIRENEKSSHKRNAEKLAKIEKELALLRKQKKAANFDLRSKLPSKEPEQPKNFYWPTPSALALAATLAATQWVIFEGWHTFYFLVGCFPFNHLFRVNLTQSI